MADKKHKIYTKKPVASPVSFGLTLDRLEIRGPEIPQSPKEHEASKPPTDPQKEADRLLLAKYVPPAVVVNEHMDILQTRGHTGRYLELLPGKASLNLLKMARPGLMFELQKAFEAARKSGASVRKEGVQVESNGDLKQVNVEIIPLKAATSSPQNYMIIFEDDRSEPVRHSASAKRKSAKASDDGALQKDRQIAQLKQELAATKEYLQSIIEEREATNEELQSANEEIQSANEELQSTNEELQTSKEELESANEELNTVNEEMQHRNAQLAQLNNDLVNLLNSVNIPIVMLGQDLSVRRFTPQAEKVLGLSAVDMGRSISNIKLKIDVSYLEQAVLDVLRDIIPKQQQVKDQSGTPYTMRITPYRTSDNKIDGAVVILLA